MIEFITQNLDTILTAIGLSGGASLLTLRATRARANADAMKSVQEVYRGTIEDLRGENKYLREEITSLREDVTEIRRKQNDLYKWKCIKIDCKERIKK